MVSMALTITRAAQHTGLRHSCCTDDTQQIMRHQYPRHRSQATVLCRADSVLKHVLCCLDADPAADTSGHTEWCAIGTDVAGTNL
jgi:hypothetical protein